MTKPDATYTFTNKTTGRSYSTCKECKRVQYTRKAEQSRSLVAQRKRKRKAWTPDATDPAVIRARQERERVLTNRLKYGPEWFKVAA